jgi:transcriptional regulator with XRE-family HTH domain
MEQLDEKLDMLIPARIRRLRNARGMTLDQLAEASGVSRAMISRIERGEASPTAVLLARLLTPLNETLSGFFSSVEEAANPLSARKDQAVWRDPETGYVRRAVSPLGFEINVDLVEVELPAGARVAFPPMPLTPPQSQYVWLFDGELSMDCDGATHQLKSGDCLFMTLSGGITFHNRSSLPCRYAIILKKA